MLDELWYRRLGAWTVALGGVLGVSAAVIAGGGAVLVNRGLSKGGDFGALGVIAAMVVGAAALPAVLVCAWLARVYLRAGQTQRKHVAGSSLSPGRSTAATSLGLSVAAALVLVLDHHPLVRLAAAAVLALFGGHAAASLARPGSYSVVAAVTVVCVGLAVAAIAAQLLR